jgi:hypothetical protein
MVVSISSQPKETLMSPLRLRMIEELD